MHPVFSRARAFCLCYNFSPDSRHTNSLVESSCHTFSKPLFLISHLWCAELCMLLFVLGVKLLI